MEVLAQASGIHPSSMGVRSYDAECGPARETPMLVMTDHNLMMLSSSSQHPLITRIANRLCAMFKLSQTKQIHRHWFFHYVFHPPALACFLIGFLGLLSVELQILAVRPLENKFNAQVSASVDQFSSTIASSINASMYNQSATYANTINTPRRHCSVDHQ